MDSSTEFPPLEKNDYQDLVFQQRQILQFSRIWPVEKAEENLQILIPQLFRGIQDLNFELPVIFSFATEEPYCIQTCI